MESEAKISNTQQNTMQQASHDCVTIFFYCLLNQMFEVLWKNMNG